MTVELVRYDAMCTAIAEAKAVDEVKDIRDKALALAAYARQAKNYDLEIDLCRIRLRAERKAGQLLKQMGEVGERARGGGDLRKELSPPTLSDLNINRDQSSDWQKLAGVPEADFEAALAARPENRREFPTTASLIAKPKVTRVADADSSIQP